MEIHNTRQGKPLQSKGYQVQKIPFMQYGKRLQLFMIIRSVTMPMVVVVHHPKQSLVLRLIRKSKEPLVCKNQQELDIRFWDGPNNQEQQPPPINLEKKLLSILQIQKLYYMRYGELILLSIIALIIIRMVEHLYQVQRFLVQILR